MGENPLKNTYINLFLLAAADGRFDPAEEAYLQKFTSLASINDAEAADWRKEASRDMRFRTIENDTVAVEALKIMARMLRVDGEFSDSEQTAYIKMGKSLGFSHDQLGVALREHWDSDPLDQMIREVPKEKSPEIDVVDVLVVDDDMLSNELLEQAAPKTGIVRASLKDIVDAPPTEPRMVLFHAAEERDDSIIRFNTLRESIPGSYIAFVARRDQAPQIGLLLEKGARRCFVEPLYPAEISKALSEIPS